MPSVGSYIPQFGPTYGAKIVIAGSTNIPQPTWLKYIPPVLAFKTLRGQPIYQGLPQVLCHWDHMDVDGFQALSVAFFTLLNLEDGPIVDVLWPSPYEAGRYVEAKAYLEWPAWDQWAQNTLQGVEVTLSSLSLEGQGLWF